MIQLGMLFFFCEDLLWICYTAELGCIVAGECFHDDTIKLGKLQQPNLFLKLFKPILLSRFVISYRLSLILRQISLFGAVLGTCWRKHAVFVWH